MLRRELAALVVHAQAMDASLEQDGIRGRGGEPRSLIDRRLRLNDRLRNTLTQYLESPQEVGVAPLGAADRPDEEGEASAEQAEPLVDTIARFHYRDDIASLEPVEVDAERFLRAVVLTEDPAVTDDDRLYARKSLTRWARERAEFCVCSATLVARDEFELRDWIEEAKAAGVEPHEGDAGLATRVRQLASGERLEPWRFYQRSSAAVTQAIEVGVARVLTGAAEQADRTVADDDAAIGTFWKTVLSPSVRVKARQRLKVFNALDEAGALPRCKCDRTVEQREELKDDQLEEYFIRSVGQRHYRAAMIIAHFPETYYAVRDAIDAKVQAEREKAANEAEAS